MALDLYEQIMVKTNNVDVVILGAGAAGLFCARIAAARGRRVLVIDHAAKIGEKIRISGGGRCNFTNIHTGPENILSQNPRFCISALKRYTPQDFIQLVESHGIAWHEKTLGQLFCDDSAVQIVDMLVEGAHAAGAEIRTGTQVQQVSKTTSGFRVETSTGPVEASSLVVATGGKSIPKIGATGFGYQVAAQFGLDVIEPRPALVPLTFEGVVKDMAKGLAGVSVEAIVSSGKASFREGFLFTHRGLSGPSILQISSYWREGKTIEVNLCPDQDVYKLLRARRQAYGRIEIQTALAEILPKRLAQSLSELEGWSGNLADWSDEKLRALCERLSNWQVLPAGSEGYRTAEVTLGGVDTTQLNSKTMAVNDVPGLFFIGEVVDVTGWLGGYNFQWAWASAHAAAQVI